MQRSVGPHPNTERSISGRYNVPNTILLNDDSTGGSQKVHQYTNDHRRKLVHRRQKYLCYMDYIKIIVETLEKCEETTNNILRNAETVSLYANAEKN